MHEILIKAVFDVHKRSAARDIKQCWAGAVAQAPAQRAVPVGLDANR